MLRSTPVSINCTPCLSIALAGSFLTIGAEDGRTICPQCNGTRYFKGQIDEVAIYKRALSTSEIHGIYLAGGAGKTLPSGVDGTR